MNRHASRRSFLALLATGLLAACGRAPGQSETPTPPSPTSVPTPEPTPAPSQATPTVGAPATRQAIVGMAEGDDMAQMVPSAIERAGGFAGLRRGATVFVKPNVNSDDPYPGTTNPAVLGAVVRALFAAGAGRVIVADRSNPRWGTLAAMQKTGIYQAAVAAGAEVVALENATWRRVRPAGASNWRDGLVVPDLLDQVDYVVTVPVTKTHSIATFTMSLKNNVGLIHPDSRNEMHRAGEPQFGAMIAEISLARRPDFVVMDGSRAFVRGGPSTGTMVEPRLVVASADVVANDVVGLAVLRALGTIPAIADRSPWAQPQIARAVELGLGAANAAAIVLRGDDVSRLADIQRLLS